MNRIASLISCAMAVAASGCATMIAGTTQRVVVVTDPLGAQCTVRNGRADHLGIVPDTPGDADVRRDSTPLEVRCTKDGHVDGTASYLATDDPTDFEYRRQIVVAEVFLRHLDTSEDAMARSVGDADRERRMNAIANAARSATIAAPGLAFVGAGGSVAAVAAAAPLALALFAVAPISFGIDYATGAAYLYPPVVVLFLPSVTFADETSRSAYFAEVDRRIDLAREALRNEAKARWCFLSGCDERREKADDALIAQWRARITEMRRQTQVTVQAVPEASQPHEKEELEAQSGH